MVAAWEKAASLHSRCVTRHTVLVTACWCARPPLLIGCSAAFVHASSFVLVDDKRCGRAEPHPRCGYLVSRVGEETG